MRATNKLDYPVSGVVMYRRSIKVMRRAPQWRMPPPREDHPIAYLSRSSLDRLVFTVLNNNLVWRSLLTLTYSEHWTKSGLQVKRQLNTFLTGYRRKYANWSYLWWLEFQRRGAPHLHVLSLVEVDQDDRDWMAEYWSSYIAEDEAERGRMYRVHRHERNWENIRKPDGARRYAMMYASKPYQKKVPKDFRDVGRFWGCSRDVSRSAKEIMFSESCSEFDARLICKAAGRDMATWKNLPKHIWIFDNRNADV